MPTSTRWRGWLLRGLTCSIVAVALGIPGFVALGPYVERTTKSAGIVAIGIERPAAPVTPASDNEGRPSRTGPGAREALSCNRGPLRILLKGVNYPYPRVECVCSFGDTSCEKHQTSWPNQGTTTPPKGLHEAYAPPATVGQREPGYPWLRCYPRRELVPNTRVAS